MKSTHLSMKWSEWAELEMLTFAINKIMMNMALFDHFLVQRCFYHFSKLFSPVKEFTRLIFCSASFSNPNLFTNLIANSQQNTYFRITHSSDSICYQEHTFGTTSVLHAILGLWTDYLRIFEKYWKNWWWTCVMQWNLCRD